MHVSEDAIDRYALWKEQNGICMYTGRNILVSELFVGNSFDVEHTIPRSLSGDDSLSNKTVCDAQERTGASCVSELGSDKHSSCGLEG